MISFEKTNNPLELHENILWTPLRYHKNPPVLSTLYDINNLRHKAKALVKEHKIEIVHCRSYITSLVGLALKRKYAVKFIFDMRGFWADERVEGGLWNLGNPFYRWIYNYFKRKERDFIEESDSIISLTKSGKQELLHNSIFNIRHSIFEEKIKVIPTCVDTDLFNPAKVSETQKSNLRKSLGIDLKDYVLMYIGSLGTWYMLDEMISFFRQLKKIKPGSKFVILTNSNNYATGEEGIIVARAKREEVPHYLAICNATICFIRPTFSKKASSATKIWESLAMGKPIIVNDGWGDMGIIFKEDDLGYQVENFEEKEIKSDVHKILGKEWEPQGLSEVAIRKAGLKKGIDKYDELYKYSLTVKKTRGQQFPELSNYE